MGRLGSGLQILESYAGSAIRRGEASDDALLALLVRMAGSDGHLDDGELAMLHGVLGGNESEAKAYIRRVQAEPLDLNAVRAALDTDDRRWMTLRFLARMAGRDAQLTPSERGLLDDLARAFDMPEGSVERALREAEGPPAERLTAASLRAIVEAIGWDAAATDLSPVASQDLAAVVPAGAHAVMRIGVDQAEVLGLYEEGLVGRFLEGAAFLPWSTIVGCSRGRGLESSVRVFTEDGRIWSVVDSRLGALALIMDRLYRASDPPRPTQRPVISRVSAGKTWDGSEGGG